MMAIAVYIPRRLPAGPVLQSAYLNVEDIGEAQNSRLTVTVNHSFDHIIKLTDKTEPKQCSSHLLSFMGHSFEAVTVIANIYQDICGCSSLQPPPQPREQQEQAVGIVTNPVLPDRVTGLECLLLTDEQWCK